MKKKELMGFEPFYKVGLDKLFDIKF